MIAIAALFVAVFLAVSASGVVPGKGSNSYLVGGTLSGAGMATPARFGLDGSHDHLIPLHVPFNGIELPADQLAKLDATVFPYRLTLHYDYGRYPGRIRGEQDRVARFDGKALLYFERAQAGYGPGWFQAPDRLAERLRIETAWAKLPPELSDFKPEPFSAQFRRIAIMLSLTIASIGTLYLRGTKPANVPPSVIEERLSRRELQLYPGAWR